MLLTLTGVLPLFKSFPSFFLSSLWVLLSLSDFTDRIGSCFCAWLCWVWLSISSWGLHEGSTLCELVCLLSLTKCLLVSKAMQERGRVGKVGKVVVDLVLLSWGNSLLLKTRDGNGLFFTGWRYGWNFSVIGSLNVCFMSASWIWSQERVFLFGATVCRFSCILFLTGGARSKKSILCDTLI